MSHSIREWGLIGIGDDQPLRRDQADRLLDLADRAAPALGLKPHDEEGEKILIDGHKRLRAQQVVGILAMPDTTLEILPKIAQENGATRAGLIHMLSVVHDFDLATRDLTGMEAQKHDLLELLIARFASDLLKELRHGITQDYQPEEEDLRALKGRLDVIRQFSLRAGRRDRLACRYDERSPDAPINRILKAAVMVLLRLARKRMTQQALTEALDHLADVAPLPRGPVRLPAFTRQTRRFASLCRRAKLFLDRHFQSTSSGKSEGIALLFRMNLLFEEWVATLLHRQLAPLGWQVTLQAGGRSALRREGRAVFALRPDIVLQRGAEIHVIDTKWKRLAPPSDPKRGVAQGDIYQLLAYRAAWQAESVMLLYPTEEETSRIDTLHMAEGHPFRLLEIPMQDPRQSGAALGALICEALAQGSALISER